MNGNRLIVLHGDKSTIENVFNPPIELKPNDTYMICLTGLNVYNSIPNIDGSNDAFVFRVVGDSQWRTIRIPHGTYEIDAISDYLNKAAQESIDANKRMRRSTRCPAVNNHDDEYYNDDGDDDDDPRVCHGSSRAVETKKRKIESEHEAKDDRPIDLMPNNNTLKCEIKSKYEIDFTRDGTIGPLLGFVEKRKLKANVRYESDDVVNIMKVNNIFVRCNIVDGSYLNGKLNHSLYSFYPNVDPGYKINICPTNWIFLPIVETNRITRIIVDLVDQNNKLIDFRGEELTVTLYLKKF